MLQVCACIALRMVHLNGTSRVVKEGEGGNSRSGANPCKISIALLPRRVPVFHLNASQIPLIEYNKLREREREREKERKRERERERRNPDKKTTFFILAGFLVVTN